MNPTAYAINPRTTDFSRFKSVTYRQEPVNGTKLSIRCSVIFPRTGHRRPLSSREVVVNLIGNTTTTERLQIHARLDDNTYEAGIKISDHELSELEIEQDEFHGEWNYRMKPRNRTDSN